MNLFSDSFLADIRMAIVGMVQDAIKAAVPKQSEQRYLQQNEARRYVGGIDHPGFQKLVAAGLPEIRVDGMLRYDKRDIDEFMAKYKI